MRQEHPGEGAPPYRDFAEKLADAQRYAREYELAWPVLVDDLVGTVHHEYGGMSNPTYLIDAEGRIAFYELLFQKEILARALTDLLAQGGRGVVAGGFDGRFHRPSSLRAAWPALRRGSPTSVLDVAWVFTVALAPVALFTQWLIKRARMMKRR